MSLWVLGLIVLGIVFAAWAYRKWAKRGTAPVLDTAASVVGRGWDLTVALGRVGSLTTMRWDDPVNGDKSGKAIESLTYLRNLYLDAAWSAVKPAAEPVAVTVNTPATVESLAAELAELRAKLAAQPSAPPATGAVA
jgi:hypothetical protein